MRGITEKWFLIVSLCILELASMCFSTFWNHINSGRKKGNNLLAIPWYLWGTNNQTRHSCGVDSKPYCCLSCFEPWGKWVLILIPGWSSGADQRLLRAQGHLLGRPEGAACPAGELEVHGASSRPPPPPLSVCADAAPDCRSEVKQVWESAPDTRRRCWADGTAGHTAGRSAGGLQEDQPRSRMKKGYSARTVSSSCRNKNVHFGKVAKPPMMTLHTEEFSPRKGFALKIRF